ncbi:hypothetical protein LWM68_11300 [Niabella sp. W65]|nr:hypothetical protein [Niabella sp. W65]MCH7363296.1 hypothetical protein [Niabella sp. W65]ULT39225.1 hypothetical protein KRR40_30050 [Niabella sp. I65]
MMPKTRADYFNIIALQHKPLIQLYSVNFNDDFNEKSEKESHLKNEAASVLLPGYKKEATEFSK